MTAPASYAMDVQTSRGRLFPEPKHPYRNDFARDRDRVIHSRAFRRLEAKTQVFTTRFSDHFRNRLTHTIEVSQIARTVSEVLGLNTDLVEALALVHDIGHPPFGHAGERQLDLRMREVGQRFNHNLHALRIVEQFETRYVNFAGLNLTFEVREGIVKHSHDYSASESPDLAEYLLDRRPLLEAQLIDFVDEIAYGTADLDDAFEARLLEVDSLCQAVPGFGKAYGTVDQQHPDASRSLKFNEALKRMLDSFVTDLIETTRARLKSGGIETVEDVRNFPSRLVAFSPETAEEANRLKQFLTVNVYSHPAIVEDRERSVGSLDALFSFFLENPGEMPRRYALLAGKSCPHRVVCDYVAGMTDHFLLRRWEELSTKPVSTKAT